MSTSSFFALYMEQSQLSVPMVTYGDTSMKRCTADLQTMKTTATTAMLAEVQAEAEAQGEAGAQELRKRPKGKAKVEMEARQRRVEASRRRVEVSRCRVEASQRRVAATTKRWRCEEKEVHETKPLLRAKLQASLLTMLTVAAVPIS